MTEPTRIHIFQAYGIELEYMIVDRQSLRVRPITDELLRHVLGTYESDYANGRVTWSNELVLHVVELKSTKPDNDFVSLESAFAENISQINKILEQWDAMLLPSAAHPLMDPLKETQLWPHESNEVYAIYNGIFDCRGHGWSNLQSMHLNLPFYDDEEFAKLHAAVRIVLPLLPALCASSPILDGKPTGLMDTRLKYYKTNQARIPSITGKVIPEAVFSKRNYLNTIYERIKIDIAPFDPAGELNAVWVNSRGAIPRFDRGSIEIRIMDIQECPHADLAIASLVIALIKALASERLVDREAQMHWKTDALAELLDLTVAKGGDALIENAEYLEMFGLHAKTASAASLWKHLLQWLEVAGESSLHSYHDAFDVILDKGTLAKRLLSALGPQPSSDALLESYHQLAVCLAENKMYQGK
ncbi:MAG TPA: glutamate-cysteine ligase family protein [Chryseolinea sp.]|nr:glutamate-cysteine ligase family protein [Chryseolinea sp.]